MDLYGQTSDLNQYVDRWMDDMMPRGREGPLIRLNSKCRMQFQCSLLGWEYVLTLNSGEYYASSCLDENVMLGQVLSLPKYLRRYLGTLRVDYINIVHVTAIMIMKVGYHRPVGDSILKVTLKRLTHSLSKRTIIKLHMHVMIMINAHK